MARLSKYDLCEKCRQICPEDSMPIEQYIDKFSTIDYQSVIHGMHFEVERMLKNNGGCQNCINLLRKINAD